jgi:magnesium transporter
VKDAITVNQRYGDTLFIVLRSAHYRDDSEQVDFGELHLFVGPNFVLTVRHGDSPDLAAVRRRVEDEPNQRPERLPADLRKVVEFQRATRPLLVMLDSLSTGFAKEGVEEELQRHLHDVADHATLVVEQADRFRGMLADVLTVDTTLVTQAQNEEKRRLAEASNAQNEQIKRISAWAATLFVPTLIGTIYGMNFYHMPELNWVWGYPFPLLLMAMVCAGLYLIFKRRRWL